MVAWKTRSEQQWWVQKQIGLTSPIVGAWPELLLLPVVPSRARMWKSSISSRFEGLYSSKIKAKFFATSCQKGQAVENKKLLASGGPSSSKNPKQAKGQQFGKYSALGWAKLKNRHLSQTCATCLDSRAWKGGFALLVQLDVFCSTDVAHVT